MPQKKPRAIVKKAVQEGVPAWIPELQDAYTTGTHHCFLVTGNIRDLGDNNAREVLIKMGERNCEVTVVWDKAGGFVVQGDDTVQDWFKAKFLTQPGVPAEFVPEPSDITGADQALAIITGVLNRSKIGSQDYRAMVVIDFADSVFPDAPMAQLNEHDRKAVVVAQKWSRDRRIAERGHLVVLLARSVQDVHADVRGAATHYRHVQVRYPGLDERGLFLRRRAETEVGLALEDGLTQDEMANTTSGLNLLQLEDLCMAGDVAGGVTRSLIRRVKDAVLAAEGGDVLEPMYPRWGFEAVGGLEHVIAFMLANVIQPMRSGNFARVPMGVLLLGPAGTGKTLIAEATAKEAGINAVQLRLAKILGKYVGDSLCGEEELVLHTPAGIQRMTIADAVRDQPAATVGSMYDNGDAVTLPVLRYIEHDPRATILAVTTKTGRRLHITHDHSVFSFCDGLLREVRGDELVAGSPIALPCGWEVPAVAHAVDLVALIQQHGDEESWRIADTHRFLPALKGVTGNAWYSYRAGTSTLPLRRGIELALIDDDVQLRLRSGDTVLPRHFTLTEEHAFLAGQWLADGSATPDKRMRLTCHEDDWPAIQASMPSLRFTVHPNKGARAVSAFLSDGALGRILMLLGSNGTSTEKRVPAWVLGARDSIASAFLRGYFSGDGSFHAHVVEVETISSKAAQDIAWLLARFGIIASVRERPLIEKSILGNPIGNRHMQHRITISRGTFLRQFAEKIGFAQPAKQAKLEHAIASLDFEWKSPVEHNVFQDKIATVTEVPYGNPVYDLEVAGTHRFVTASGMLVHNSERNLEKALEIISSMTPCIVFIDEIDQQFSRGSGNEGDSGVSNRLFARVMEFAADTSHRGQVIVLAASNRPDLLDAALKRPGRFDRKIVFPPPGTREQRLAIFEAIGRKYTITIQDHPGVLLDEIAGWTGNEIEGLMLKASELAEDDGSDVIRERYWTEAFDLYLPSTQDIERMLDLALREVNDLSLVPAEYRNRVREMRRAPALEPEIENAAGARRRSLA